MIRLVLLLLMMMPTNTWACAVCGGGGQNADAFLHTFILLTTAPLLMIGGIIAALVYMARQADEQPRRLNNSPRPKPVASAESSGPPKAEPDPESRGNRGHDEPLDRVLEMVKRLPIDGVPACW